jgi:hypothetical protein
VQDEQAKSPEVNPNRCEAESLGGRRCGKDRLPGQQFCAEHGGVTDTAKTLDTLHGADKSVWSVNGVPKRLSDMTSDERRDMGQR